jgi:hypothetical protein
MEYEHFKIDTDIETSITESGAPFKVNTKGVTETEDTAIASEDVSEICRQHFVDTIVFDANTILSGM